MTATLDTLKAGQSGIIIKVNGGGAVRRHLFDMGLTPGAKVGVRRIAPFGDPIELTVRQYSLSIRKSEAKNIVIQKDQINKGIK